MQGRIKDIDDACDRAINGFRALSLDKFEVAPPSADANTRQHASPQTPSLPQSPQVCEPWAQLNFKVTLPPPASCGYGTLYLDARLASRPGGGAAPPLVAAADQRSIRVPPGQFQVVGCKGG